MPWRSTRRCAWVPLPEPGAPRKTIRMMGGTVPGRFRQVKPSGMLATH